MFLGLKEGLVECATVWVKSVVILDKAGTVRKCVFPKKNPKYATIYSAKTFGICWRKKSPYWASVVCDKEDVSTS